MKVTAVVFIVLTGVTLGAAPSSAQYICGDGRQAADGHTYAACGQDSGHGLDEDLGGFVNGVGKTIMDFWEPYLEGIMGSRIPERRGEDVTRLNSAGTGEFSPDFNVRQRPRPLFSPDFNVRRGDPHGGSHAEWSVGQGSGHVVPTEAWNGRGILPYTTPPSNVEPPIFSPRPRVSE